MAWEERCRTIELLLDPEGLFWIVDLQGIGELEAQSAAELLDAESKQRAQRFVSEADRYRYLVTHACLRAKLGARMGKKPSEIAFLKNEYGKPHIEGNAFYFNLSHSKKKAFFGIHPSSPIGVDVEDADRQLSPTLAGHSPKEVDAFLRAWCAEEAYLKAKGTGFAGGRPQLEHAPSSQEIDVFEKGDARIHVYNQTVPGCKLAVCVWVASS